MTYVLFYLCYSLTLLVCFLLRKTISKKMVQLGSQQYNAYSNIFKLTVFLVCVLFCFIFLQITFKLELIGKYSDLLFYYVSFSLLDLLLIGCIPKYLKTGMINWVHWSLSKTYASLRILATFLGFCYILYGSLYIAINAIPTGKDYESDDIKIFNNLYIAFGKQDDLKIFRRHFFIFKRKALELDRRDLSTIDLRWSSEGNDYENEITKISIDSVAIDQHEFDLKTHHFITCLLIVHKDNEDCFVGYGIPYDKIAFLKCVK